METRNDIPNLLAMYIRNTREIYDITTWLQEGRQGHTAINRTPSKLQHNENYNQRGRQTVIQVRRNNTIKDKNIMIQFTIDSFSGGLSGRPYNSIKDAIQDGGYSVWCNEKIKLAFNFGNGTEKDFKRYCKDNKCKIISENEFYKELYSLPLNEQKTHIQFIREQLTIIMTYEKEIRPRPITVSNI